jgi:hypothetical protein
MGPLLPRRLGGVVHAAGGFQNVAGPRLRSLHQPSPKYTAGRGTRQEAHRRQIALFAEISTSIFIYRLGVDRHILVFAATSSPLAASVALKQTKHLLRTTHCVITACPTAVLYHNRKLGSKFGV